MMSLKRIPISYRYSYNGQNKYYSVSLSTLENVNILMFLRARELKEPVS